MGRRRVTDRRGYLLPELADRANVLDGRRARPRRDRPHDPGPRPPLVGWPPVEQRRARRPGRPRGAGPLAPPPRPRPDSRPRSLRGWSRWWRCAALVVGAGSLSAILHGHLTGLLSALAPAVVLIGALAAGSDTRWFGRPATNELSRVVSACGVAAGLVSAGFLAISALMPLVVGLALGLSALFVLLGVLERLAE